jgi:hypothetical protein
MSAHTQDHIPAPPRAVRLVFRYEGEEISLVSRRPIDMISPPSDSLSGYEDEQGFWIEVRNEQAEILHRQVMSDPLLKDVEVFSPDPAQSIFRTPVEKPSGIFTVVVPDLDEADHVALIGSAEPGAARRQAGPTAEIARFSLRHTNEGGNT